MNKQDLEYRILQLRTVEELVDFLNSTNKEIFGNNAKSFTVDEILRFSNPNLMRGRYTTFDIKKKSGGIRHIYAPTFKLLCIQRCLNEIFKLIYIPNECAHGFSIGKSIVSNSVNHTKKNYVYNIDLKDFFPSIHQARVWKRIQLPPFKFHPSIANYIAGLCSIKLFPCDYTGKEKIEYVLPQGAPTSPLLSNAICDSLDRKLNGLAKRFGLSYSRYADDITFSSMHNVYQENGEFITELHRIINNQNFRINEAKTRLQVKGNRQEVTGLSVNEKSNVPRSYYRSVRQLLFIWHNYGIKDACSSYAKNNNISEPHSEKLKYILQGKLNYIKMVKGESAPDYMRLKQEFDFLLDKAKNDIEKKSTRLLKFKKTLSFIDFLRETNLKLTIYIGKKGRLIIRNESGKYAKYENKRFYASMNIKTNRTHRLFVSLCSREDDSEFYLVHEKVTHRKK